MAGSDSEEDYMSDAFLAKCQDTRPGLVPTKVAKQYEQEKKHKELCVTNRTKPKKQLEEEQRSEGLKQAISSSNKGFAMLQKMGYKPGMALGKQGTGRKEPVPVEILAKREGLGQQAEKKRRSQEMNAMRAVMVQKRHKREQTQKLDYRKEKQKQMTDKKTLSDLYNSQRVCETLDMEQGYDEPNEVFFWTPSTITGIAEREKAKDKDNNEACRGDDGYHFEEQDHEDDDGKTDDGKTVVEPSELDIKIHAASLMLAEDQLASLTSHLRKTYLYCVWCGTRFDDGDDQNTNCPGDTADAHEDM